MSLASGVAPPSSLTAIASSGQKTREKTAAIDGHVAPPPRLKAIATSRRATRKHTADGNVAPPPCLTAITSGSATRKRSADGHVRAPAIAPKSPQAAARAPDDDGGEAQVAPTPTTAPMHSGSDTNGETARTQSEAPSDDVDVGVGDGGVDNEAQVVSAAPLQSSPVDLSDDGDSDADDATTLSDNEGTLVSARQAEPSVSVVKSQRGAEQLCVDGHIYHAIRTHKGRTYWVCEQNTKRSTTLCGAKAISSRTEGDTIAIHKLDNHTHAPNPAARHLKAAMAAIKGEARSTKNKPCVIMQAQRTAAGELATVVAPLMPSKHATRLVIGRVRRQNKLKEPQDIKDINIPETLRSSLTGAAFFRKDIAVGVERVLLFATEESLRLLEKCEVWIADGTFQTAPKCFMQLFTIHGCVGNSEVLPLVYALMTKRTNESYDAVLKALVESADNHNLVLNPKVVITDFEQAEMRSFVREFDGVQSKGCLFHLGQSIYRRLQQHGLAQRYGTDVMFALKVRMLFALAYLPASDIGPAFADLKSLYDETMAPVLSWFEGNYVLGKKRRNSQLSRGRAMFPPVVWSVHESVVQNLPRTQNKVESWHNRWRVIVGAKPGVYELVGHLREEDHRVQCEAERIRAGVIQRQNKHQHERDEALLRIVEGRHSCSTEQYLRAIANHLLL